MKKFLCVTNLLARSDSVCAMNFWLVSLCSRNVRVQIETLTLPSGRLYIVVLMSEKMKCGLHESLKATLKGSGQNSGTGHHGQNVHAHCFSSIP